MADIAVARYYLALNKGRSSRVFLLVNKGRRSRGEAKFVKVRGGFVWKVFLGTLGFSLPRNFSSFLTLGTP